MSTIMLAESTVVDYLNKETDEILLELCMSHAYITDLSMVSDFPLGKNHPDKDKYIWQVAIDRLRLKGVH